MKTLAVVGTCGGAGTTTVAALAFAGLRHHPAGAPMLYGRPSARLLERVGSDEVPLLNGDTAIWDAGVHSPQSAAALLEAGGCALVVAAPATPLGVADAVAMLTTVAELGEDSLAWVTVVLSQVNGPGRAVPAPAIPGQLLVRLPYDRALATPSAIPAVEALRRPTRAVVQGWQRRAAALLMPPP